MSKFAWVTLTTNDTYSLGALVLAHSLRRAGTAHQLAVLVTPGVSNAMREKLKDVYNVVQEVNVMDSQDAANLALLSRPELGITFTKLHCWRLVQFEKCVFLDSDTLVLQNCDELFEREELSAAPDVSWPDCFNSGVFVFKPSLDTFAKITEFALKHGSFDGGDQGLLNQYFEDWAHADIKKHLPFVYNVTAYASYCYLPAFKQFRNKIKILHFAGKMKPWLIQFNSESKVASCPSDYSHAADLIQLWWNIFCENVHKNLSDSMNFCPAFIQRLYYDSCFQEINQNPIRNPNPIQYHQYFHQHEYHEYHHEHEDPGLQLLDSIYQVQEFQDPWQDYYKNLQKQQEEEELQRQQREQREQREQQEREQQQFQEQQQQQHNYHENYFGKEPETEPEPTPYQFNPEQDQYFESKPQDSHSQDEQNYQEHFQEKSHSGSQSEIKEFQQEPRPEHHEQIAIENEHEKVPKDLNESSSRNTSSTAPTATTAPSTTTAIPKVSFELKDECPASSGKDTKEVCIEDPKTAATDSNHDEAGLAGALAQLRLGSQRTPEQEAYENLMRRQCWESGQIDYCGKDSFENIWKQISSTLEQKPSQPQGDDKSGSD